jgi:hypothetical protein
MFANFRHHTGHVLPFQTNVTFFSPRNVESSKALALCFDPGEAVTVTWNGVRFST